MLQSLSPEYMGKLFTKTFLCVPRDYLYESAQGSAKRLKRHLPRFYYYLSLRPIKSIISHLQTEVFLISFPKCGRTWLRLMIGKVLADLYGIDEKNLLNLKRMARSRREIPAIRVAHEDNPDYKTPEELSTRKPEFSDKRVIFLVRDPRDVVVSLYHQKKYRERCSWEIPDLAEFIRRERGSAKTIAKYYNVWIANRNIPQDFLLIRYEDMQKNTVQELKRVISFLGIEGVSDSILRNAAEFAKFDKMRAMEKKNAIKSRALKPGDPQKKQSYKTRKGEVGGYRRELSKADILFLNDLIKTELKAKIGYSGNVPMLTGKN